MYSRVLERPNGNQWICRCVAKLSKQATMKKSERSASFVVIVISKAVNDGWSSIVISVHLHSTLGMLEITLGKRYFDLGVTAHLRMELLPNDIEMSFLRKVNAYLLGGNMCIIFGCNNESRSSSAVVIVRRNALAVLTWPVLLGRL